MAEHPTPIISTLFAGDIHRRIEEVIKVDQADEAVVREEISEYVATKSLQQHFVEVLEGYRDAPNRPTEGIGVWVSGFFGSGKSSFAKLLGVAIADWPLEGEPAGKLLAQRIGNDRISALLAVLREQVPTHAVIFDVSTEKGVRSNQSLTEIVYSLFLRSLGYAQDLDIAELEITLEDEGRLDDFKAKYRELTDGEWDQGKNKSSFALNDASMVLHELNPKRFATPDSWAAAAQNRADLNAGRLAERCLDLMARKRPGQSLLFVIDEIGQFVARDTQRMLDLQAIVQNLGRIGRGKLWIAVTSQEQLNEVVSGLDARRIELARLIDRFPTRIHLEQSDIAEVTGRRVLAKNAAGEQRLRSLYEANRGRLADHTRVNAPHVRLPELTAEKFLELYPLLPYQIDLVISVVSGLRAHGGASRHVGGANRTVIKLAQQLLVHRAVNLADQPVGQLVRLDQVYDLVEQNLPTEIRQKIASIVSEVPHPFAQRVAKAVCLLQYARTVPASPENLAAVLHPAVEADSCLQSVREALEALELAQKIRRGEDGYRIPTPAEDSWDRARTGLAPRPADVDRELTKAVTALWQPAPSHLFLSSRAFKAGLKLRGRVEVEGDLFVDLHVGETGVDPAKLRDELRAKSQSDPKSIYWGLLLDAGLDRELVELWRSSEMLDRRGRSAQGNEAALAAEEKNRQREHENEVRRRLRKALLTGGAFFRGNDHTPGEGPGEVRSAVERVLETALPKVYHRHGEAAAKVNQSDLDELGKSVDLGGLPAVFGALKLTRSESGHTVFVTDSGPLAEVLHLIEGRHAYGESPRGSLLAEQFGREPFGWSLDAVKLLTLALLRAGRIEVQSKAQTIDQARSPEAAETFRNNNLFKQATFRPKKVIDSGEVIRAADHFSQVFGRTVKELEAGKVAAELRQALGEQEDDLEMALDRLRQQALPGSEVLAAALDQAKNIRRGSDENALLTFNATFQDLKEAIRRAAELDSALTAPRLHELGLAREVVAHDLDFLTNEPDLGETLRSRAAELVDLLARESFFKELPTIAQHATALRAEYERRHRESSEARSSAYRQALDRLAAEPAWADLDEVRREQVRTALAACAEPSAPGSVPIPQLRADLDACPARLSQALSRLHELVEGDRVATLTAAPFFSGGIDSEEELEAALGALRQECAKLLAAGRKILIQ